MCACTHWGDRRRAVEGGAVGKSMVIRRREGGRKGEKEEERGRKSRDQKRPKK